MRSQVIICFLIFLTIRLFGQTEKDSSNFSTESYTKRFFANTVDKQLNTHSFNAQLTHSISSGNFFFGLKEIFNSTIIKAKDKNIKDEQSLRLFGQYNLSDAIKLGVLINSALYSDNRQIAINKASTLNSLLFIKLQPVKKFSFSPFGGFTNNNQIGENDNGFTYGSEANLEKYQLGDFEISSLLKFQNEDILPRKNTFRYMNFDLNNSFEENFSNTISAFFTNQRKDFYYAADPATAEEFGITNNIQSRLEANYFLQDKIQFTPKNSPLMMDIQGRVIWRNIERNTRYVSLNNISGSAFDSKIEEFRLELASSADYKTEDLNLSFRFSFSEREEKHQPRKISGLSSIIISDRERTEALKNNTSQLANISLAGLINLTSKDRLLLTLFHRKLKYDTPSNENYDDRDELLSIGKIMYERRFNSYFKAFVDLEGSFNKIVYIFAERSSNNNIQRILKLSSGGNVNLGNIYSSNSAEISANYAVFDYEELNPNFRSYSFRQLLFRDTTNIKVIKNLSLFFTGYIKHSEQGDFKWSSFKSKPSRYLEELYFEPKIFYNVLGFNFGIGIRYFSLETFNVAKGTEKLKATEYVSLGPVTEISYNLSQSLSFRTYGWYEFIRTENNNRRETANFNLKFLYNF